jgi:AcrR family transcriptional regulator
MPRKADEKLEGRIGDAAYQLWSLGGERAVTMRAVAKAAKTTTPTLYERFSDKHELIAFLRDRARHNMFEALRKGDTALEVCRLALRFTLTHGNEYLLLTSDWAERLGRRDPLPSFEFLKAKLAQDLGQPPAEYAALALALVALIHGTAILLLGESIEPGIAKQFEEACLRACEGLIESASKGRSGGAND